MLQAAKRTFVLFFMCLNDTFCIFFNNLQICKNAVHFSFFLYEPFNARVLTATKWRRFVNTSYVTNILYFLKLKKKMQIWSTESVSVCLHLIFILFHENQIFFHNREDIRCFIKTFVLIQVHIQVDLNAITLLCHQE